MRDLYEKTLHTTSIFAGKVIQVQVEDIELPNGKLGKREIVKHPGAVAIIPITRENKLVLVRQYRKALDKVIYEIPAGKLEAGEQPEDCASRELKEETGYTARKLSLVTSFYTSPGFADEIIYIYEAAEIEAGIATPDQDEFVERVEVSLEEALALIQKDEIHDAKTEYAVQYWRLKQLEERYGLSK